MNPYRIEGPAVVSVSGGRTSGFMLAKVLEAYEGKLPDNVRPIFCNTGLEHPATYEFLHEMETRWCPITWLEYWRNGDTHDVRVVTYETAARNGEPFDELIKAKGRLPNPQQRFCTSELKIRSGNRWLRSLGWKEWTKAVGLRFDEPRRVASIKGDIAAESIECPMYHAKHTVEDVHAFWAKQPFDLRLPGGDNSFGNCKLCFLKSYEKLIKIMRMDPSAADWWIKQEARNDLVATGNGKLFRIDRPSYATTLETTKRQGWLFDDRIQGDDTIPCNCTD